MDIYEILSQDLIFNIFSRLEVKQLLQLRSVSKLWRTIIDHPSLPTLHLLCTQSQPSTTTFVLLSPNSTLYLLQQNSNYLKPATKITTLPSPSNHRLILKGSSNGLLYFVQTGHDHSAVVISNPLKQQYRKLPLPPIPSQHLSCWNKYGLGFDNITHTLKMVCVFFNEMEPDFSTYKLGAMVNCVGTTTTSLWREINHVPPYPVCGAQIILHGFLHWIADPFFVSENLVGTVIRFDVSKEEFRLIPRPKFDKGDNCYCYCGIVLQLIELKGEVAMCDFSSDESIDIWVMKDYHKEEWSREYRINIRAPLGSCFSNGHTEVLGVWKDEEILLKLREGYFIYSPNSGLIRYKCSVLDDNSTVCCIRGSLISIPN